MDGQCAVASLYPVSPLPFQHPVLITASLSPTHKGKDRGERIVTVIKDWDWGREGCKERFLSTSLNHFLSHSLLIIMVRQERQ